MFETSLSQDIAGFRDANAAFEEDAELRDVQTRVFDAWIKRVRLLEAAASGNYAPTAFVSGDGESVERALRDFAEFFDRYEIDGVFIGAVAARALAVELRRVAMLAMELEAEVGALRVKLGAAARIAALATPDYHAAFQRDAAIRAGVRAGVVVDLVTVFQREANRAGGPDFGGAA